jgi:hypothetical protein
MSSLKSRIGQLEKAPALAGTAPLKSNDLSACRRRCELMLEVSGTPGERADLEATIASIDAGTYPLPEPLPSNMDERAKRTREMMIAEFDID